MAALSSPLRNQLSRSIVKARRAAEGGSRSALTSLAVDRREPHGTMTGPERDLRRRLRAHGRQLGDRRDPDQGTQAIVRLTRECAYSHWHRMLFARFLAENDLLLEPTHGVAVTLEECEELAREAGRQPWALAASFAQGMLPQVFRVDDPVLEIDLPPQAQQELERLLASLPREVFTADDSLGWTYQYWQTDRKDEVNAAGVRIGADELPAVTQLFTEHYMVLFLYHNTIGAWHAGKLLAANPELAETAQSEIELREAVRLTAAGGYGFEYLRFVRAPKEGDDEESLSGPWRPAAGTFEGWPKAAKDLTLLDPCCGSGHFLTAGLELLVRLRMEEEDLNHDAAISKVIEENLHGLEIDPRCTQIAAFNVAMAAWKMAGSAIELPPMHIACSGLAIGSTKAEWVQLAGGETKLEAGMARLYELFEEAPTLGSLLDPRSFGGNLFHSSFEELQPHVDAALAKETAEISSADQAERAVAAQGMTKAAALMARHYTLAITNVPYLGGGQQDEVLKAYAEEVHPEAKNDLATMFVERMLRWTEPSGSIAAVTPQNWLFLTSYKKLRKTLLTRRTWDFVARLGVGAFETISGHVVNVALPILSAKRASEAQAMGGIDASAAKTAADKATLLRGEPIEALNRPPTDFAVKLVEQGSLLHTPGFRIRFEQLTSRPSLRDFVVQTEGLTTGDLPRCAVFHWETGLCFRWNPIYGKLDRTHLWSARTRVVRWEGGTGPMTEIPGARITGTSVLGQQGVLIRQMGALPSTLYSGEFFDDNCAVIVPRNKEDLPAIWSFVSSREFGNSVKSIDQSLKVTSSALVQVSIDLEYWQRVAIEEYPNGIPEPQSDDPTQWIFHGHPAKAEPHAVLQVAVGRLLGYRWPPELDPEMRLADEARAWVSRCGELLPLADKDGIVCLEATNGEAAAASRLRALLESAIGDKWSPAKERELLAAIAADKSTDKKTAQPAISLEEWLRDDFFAEHNKLFHHRPFVWHLWDGQKHGFHCLVNAHKLTSPDGEGHRTLEAITYAYLGDWIARQKAAVQAETEGAEALLAAAQHLQGQLKSILEGEPPYDLFIRWKPFHGQPLGWEPDIDDGVRLNIRPFMAAHLLKGGKKGAGILRAKPNITWKKDRGKEQKDLRPRSSFPWFWSREGDEDQPAEADYMGGPKFAGNRWNDLHYTRAAKQAARERAGEATS